MPPLVERVPRIHMLTENNVRTGFVEQADFEKLTAGTSELWLRTFLELAYTYGWRRGELLGLRVRNVDLLNRKVRLDVGSTKNKNLGNSRRHGPGRFTCAPKFKEKSGPNRNRK